MYLLTHAPQSHIPWNKGKLIGQKLPFKLKEIWAIRIRLQLANCIRDLALFNLAIDSKYINVYEQAIQGILVSLQYSIQMMQLYE